MGKREAVSRLLIVLARSHERGAAQRHLQSQSGPRYGTDPKHPDLLVCIEADGTRTLGRLEGRAFVPAPKERARRAGRSIR